MGAPWVSRDGGGRHWFTLAAMQLRKKLRRVKRFAYLGAFTGTVITVRRVRQKRANGAAPLGSPAAWPPLQAVDESPVAARGEFAEAADRADAFAATVDEPAATAVAPTTDADRGWVPPGDDGTCPMSHPIKANDNSMIYHQPGGRFYDRTRPERCYADPARAEADGFRAAKGAGTGDGDDHAGADG